LLGDVVLAGLASVSAGVSSPALVMRTVPGNFRPFKKLHMHPVVRKGSVSEVKLVPHRSDGFYRAGARR